MNELIWIASTLGVSVWQVLVGFGAIALLGGYAVANSDNTKSTEVKKVDVNINPIDLWELKKLK